jgi:hypothetical protein
MAQFHLETVVDRLLLAILGWPPDRSSRVDKWSLSAFIPYAREQWERARAQLAVDA